MSPIANTAVPRPNPDYRLEELDNELLLYHPAATKTVYLNETASLVWRLCDGHRTVAEISEILCASFPDSSTDVPQDVEDTLTTFVDHGAVELTTQP